MPDLSPLDLAEAMETPEIKRFQRMKNPPPMTTKGRGDLGHSDETMKAVVEMRATGASQPQIERALELGNGTISRWLHRGRRSVKTGKPDPRSRVAWFAIHWDAATPAALLRCAQTIQRAARKDWRAAAHVLTTHTNGGLGNRVDVNVSGHVTISQDDQDWADKVLRNMKTVTDVDQDPGRPQ